MKESGIYQIRHLESGRLYIGSAVNLSRRWSLHRTHLKHGKHHNPRLANAVSKYGLDAFVFEVLELVPVPDLIAREQWWIDHKQPEYNICRVAGSALGVKHSEETRKLHAAISTGRRHSQETRLLLSRIKSGLKYGPRSEASRLKTAAALSGKKKSSDHIQKMRERRHPEEVKMKISAAKKGVLTPKMAAHLERLAELRRQKRAA